MVVDFPMDAVAGARRTPGRLKTGGVPPKPPATIFLSLWPSVFWDFGSLFRTLRRLFLTRCCGSHIFVHVAAATSASCRGTSQQSIILQMFLQLQTLRRHVSRPVAAGASLSLQDVAASQYVCSCGAALSSIVSSFGSGSSSTSCSRSWPLNSYVFRFENAQQYWYPTWMITLTSRWTRDRDQSSASVIVPASGLSRG